MKALGILTIFTLSLVSIETVFGIDALKGRSRIDALFKWKVSDSLELDVAAEEKLGKIISGISDKRQKINEKMTKLAKDLETEKSVANRQKLLKEYRDLLKENYEAQVRELNDFEEAFGADKLAKYIGLKLDLKNKFSEFLSANHHSGDVKLADPKLIEED